MPTRKNDNKAPKPNENYVQMNVSVPINVFKRVCEECNALGISRSAYVTMTLNQKWQQDEFTKHLPDVMRTFNRMMDKLDDDDFKGF